MRVCVWGGGEGVGGMGYAHNDSTFIIYLAILVTSEDFAVIIWQAFLS